jgi:hypothetical protein
MCCIGACDLAKLSSELRLSISGTPVSHMVAALGRFYLWIGKLESDGGSASLISRYPNPIHLKPRYYRALVASARLADVKETR